MAYVVPDLLPAQNRNVSVMRGLASYNIKGALQMRLVIAAFLLSASGGLALAQTMTPGTSTAPGSSDSAATGAGPGATTAGRPRTQGNVPAATPGGPTSSESSGPDPS